MSSDVIHEFGSQEEWNESFYFNFYDRGQDICGFMRVGLKPNKKLKDVFCFLMLPDGSVLGVKDSVAMEDSELEAKGLKLVKVEDEKTWRLEFSGELPRMHKDAEKEQVSFALDFTALNSVYDYRESVSGEKEKVAQAVASEHTEQFGKVVGKLNIGTRVYDINGMGERDHSWGVRDWNAPKMWVWITCQFDEGYAFNLTKLFMDKGEVDAGFIHIDGKNVPIMRADIVTEYNRDNSPNTVYMALHDKEGDVHGVKAVVKHKSTMPFASRDGKVVSHMHECLAKFTLDDDVGYGIVEYLIRK
ncbi:MAG: hypothetical protein LUQ16_07115 [Methanomassiliicoccales archaeon]|nr:hypothetical protein [Methanomassiliicoccales archaeon]MDD1756006.1 hypothetical protein [Methanomassiliicoccales archaeon]